MRPETFSHCFHRPSGPWLVPLSFALLLAALHLAHFLQRSSYLSRYPLQREMPENSLSRPPLQLGAGLGLGLQSDVPASDMQLDERHRTRGVEGKGPGPRPAVSNLSASRGCTGRRIVWGHTSNTHTNESY